MNDYEIKNYKLRDATSSVKAALFDVTSELNVKILSLDDNDPEQVKLKKELTERLKSIMDFTNSFYDEVVLIDKSMNGVVEEKEEVQEEKDEDDDTVQISDKAIDDMMNVENEDDVTEVELEEKEEEPKEEEKEEQPVEDKGDAIVINLTDYEKLKGKKIETEEEKEEETKEKEPEEESGEKLFDLDNVKEVEEEEKTEEPVEESVEEKPVTEDLNKDDAIVLNLADYERLKENKPAEEEEKTEEEPTEEPQEEVPQEEPVEETPSEVPVETPVEETKEEEVQGETPIEETAPAIETTPPVEAISTGEVPKELTETEQAIEEQKEAVANKTISYIINKDNIDMPKAILVTSLQFDKLLLSRDDQKTLCKLRKYMVMPGEKEEEKVNLEEMLQQAEELYKQGDTEAAEELYNKISELNGN